MDYVSWTAALLEELPKLWPCLRDNVYPDSLLIRVFGMSQEQAAALPRCLTAFIVIYLICGGVTLFLHFQRRQKSLNSLAKQINNVILTAADFLLIPMLLVMWTIGRESLSTVAPYAGDTADLWRFFSDFWTALFFPLLVFLVVLLVALFPFQAALRYLRVYHLSGLPHMIFDVGTGLYLVSVLLLAAALQSRLLYLLIPLAIAMLCAAQTGGYIPDARNARGPEPSQEEKSEL